MTLIIGFVCSEGIGLVSDTKISNPSTLEATYSSKILTPLAGTSFIVGAAGFTDLFFEFNRKIKDHVDQRIRQYKIANIEQLMKTGLGREDAITRVEKLQKSISNNQQALAQKTETHDTELIDDVELPFVYSAENFLDDCKELIRTISQESGYLNPIELLIGIRSEPNTFPRLYKIDSKGREESISEYTAIGSGEPFVRMFFDRLYDAKKSFKELAKDAIRTITFTQEITKENSVGFSEEKPPEVVVVDGYSYGRIDYLNIKEIISEIKNEMQSFENLVINSKISDLVDE